MEGEATNSQSVLGGLLTLFNYKYFKVTSIYNEGNNLLCKVFYMNSNDSWFLLNVYAPNFKRKRKDYWTKLFSIIQNTNLNKGIIMGYFNSPLSNEEKIGDLTPNLDGKLDLSNFINSLALLDVDILGGVFTWFSRRIGSEFIQVRLDRALVSLDWLNSFYCKISLLPRVGTDHSPISLSIRPLEARKNHHF